MLNSSRSWWMCLAVLLNSSPVAAQSIAEGFNVDRLYMSPAGGGWFVMDELNFEGRFGGAMGLTLGYAHAPLRVGNGAEELTVVATDLAGSFASSMTYERWRFHMNIGLPFFVAGQSGTVDSTTFIAPSLDPVTLPDPVSDISLGTDLRLFGTPDEALRLGAGAQIFIPSGKRSDYVTDNTLRGMLRALAAGDVQWLTYAAQLGVHIRPLDDTSVPGSPRGSELLFGAALGARLPVGRSPGWLLTLGPEMYGATAFQSFFSGEVTALEGLFSGRLEGAWDGALQMRIRLGIGLGLHARFGAPTWRIITGIEMFGRSE